MLDAMLVAMLEGAQPLVIIGQLFMYETLVMHTEFAGHVIMDPIMAQL
jgi:hypothetical protein